MLKKIFTFFLLILIFSCNQKLERQSVSIASHYNHIPYCHSINITNPINIPEDIKKLSQASLRQKLGDSISKLLVFESTQILSDKPLSIIEKQGVTDIIMYGNDSITVSNSKKCNFAYNYPIHRMFYTLQLPEVGLKDIKLNLIIDSKNSILNTIRFPTHNYNRNKLDIIPIDSVYSEVERREISRKKLHLDAWYSQNKDVLFWSVETIISQGSILGGGCIPEVEYHFQINSKTGEIITFSENNKEAYFLDRYTSY